MSIATRTLPGQGTAADPGAQRRLQRDALRGAHQQPHAVAAADAGDRRRRRAAELGAGAAQRLGGAGQRPGDLPGPRLVGAGDDDPGEPAVGRHQRAPARLGLGAPEALVVAGEDGADRRVLGLVGLHQREPRPLGAPGAAGDLADQLEGLLGGAQVAALQPEVGVDDPDQRQQREVVPLRDELGADDEVGAAARRSPRCAPCSAPRAVGEVGGEDREPRLGPERGRLLGEPLDAGAERGHPALDLAGRAGGGDRLGRAALVADQPLAEAVLDHPRVAVRRSRPGGRRRGRWSAARSRGG